MNDQLDLFSDSTPVALRNAVLDALARRDARDAREAHSALADACPLDAHLASLGTLVGALDAPSPPAMATRAERVLARERLAGPLDEAARQAFGITAGAAWMRPFRQQLALRSAGLPFDPALPDDHAVPLWLQAGEWAMAAEATGRIESWRRIPVPLGWMAEARHRGDGLDAAWPLWVELAWLAPRRLATVLVRVGDPMLNRLRKRFEAAFDGAGDTSDLAWFPAWLLTNTPALARHLGQALPSNGTPPEQALRVLLDALVLERQGRHHELVQRRKALLDLSEPLYAIYISTR